LRRLGARYLTQDMTEYTLHPALRAALEYGPLAAFVITYVIYRDAVFTFGGTDYTGLVAVTALFLPVFILSTALLWWLTGTLTRLQIAAAGLLVIFGGLSVWLNDPALVQMKPTAVYLILGLILGLGLLRGKSWLKLVLEDVLPLKKRGWRLLTIRVTMFCLVAAAANEAVWRTQTEGFWLTFEAIVMPLIVLVFCVAQIPLFAEHTALGGTGKKRRRA